MLYSDNSSHEWVGRCYSDTPSYIIQIHLVLGMYRGKTGGKIGRNVSFLPNFTPVFPPVRPQNEVDLGDILRNVTVTCSHPLMRAIVRI